MPNHSPTHLAKMAQRSAAQRRTDKIARLVADAPALNRAQVCRLKASGSGSRLALGGDRGSAATGPVIGAGAVSTPHQGDQ